MNWPEEYHAHAARHPDCWVVRVIGHGYSVLIAVPKRDPAPPLASMPGMTLDLLDRATIKLGDSIEALTAIPLVGSGDMAAHRVRGSGPAPRSRPNASRGRRAR